MSDQLFLGAILGPVYLILGLSLLMYTETWQKIVKSWEKDHTALISLMLFTMVLGLCVINMYNIWDWSPFIIVTLTGWLTFLKGATYFLIPGDKIKALMKRFNQKRIFVFKGLIISVLGLWLSYMVYLA